MAHAIAQSQPGTRTITETGYEMTYEVVFVGPDVNGGQQSTGANIRFDFDDNNETLRAKVRRTVEESAQEFSLTVQSVQADVLIVL